MSISRSHLYKLAITIIPSPIPLFNKTPQENHIALDRLSGVSSLSHLASWNLPNGLNLSRRYSITATIWTDKSTNSHNSILKGRRNEPRLFGFSLYKNTIEKCFLKLSTKHHHLEFGLLGLDIWLSDNCPLDSDFFNRCRKYWKIYKLNLQLPLWAWQLMKTNFNFKISKFILN
jgi:hypothetical protein